MIFYTGVHQTTLARFVDRAFISVGILRRKNRQSYFDVDTWIMDSGAFTEIQAFGEFRFPVSEYAGWINKFAFCGNLEMAVSQDYMCEAPMLAKTGMTVADHQRLTIERYDTLLPMTSVPVMPVLQGFRPEEYASHIYQYGSRLSHGMRVGVGSVCKRNGKPAEIVAVLEAIKARRDDLRLHGFGLKKTSLENAYIVSMLYSADSMAWSMAARLNSRDANSGLEAASFERDIVTNSGKKPHQFVMRAEGAPSLSLSRVRVKSHDNVFAGGMKMINEVNELIKMAKIAVERIDSGLALGERLDVSPLRQAINDAEIVLEDVKSYDKTREEFKKTAYEAGKQDGSLILKTELEKYLNEAKLEDLL